MHNCVLCIQMVKQNCHEITDRHLPKVVQGVTGVKVTTSEFNSRAVSESKTSYIHGSNSQRCRRKLLKSEVCSKSIRIGILVVVHWVGCVCNQSWHVHTCLSNSWHKLQVAAFVQLAVVGRVSNTCFYVIAFLRCVKVPKKAFASSFVLKSEKPQQRRINYCSKHMVKMQWVVHKCLFPSI